MEEDKFKDLLEDEELTALRLAALATKKKTEQNLNHSESGNALPIDSIITASSASSELVSNQIPFVQSDRSAHNSYSWRKPNQSSRRRGGPFPKNNHRSNLIVISPVTLNDGKDSEEKVPALILPQHKWCNSGNEDSMSPKTLRRTGPTRFNRHGSDSESSDESDYEPSDNDSGSNETVLQDEPSEHFSHLSPGCDNLSDSVEKKRRLRFQSFDSEIKTDTFDKNEATSVYKSLKHSLYSDTKQDRCAAQQQLSDGSQTLNDSDESKYSNCNAGHTYATKTSDLAEDLIFKQSNSSVGKGDSYSDKGNVSLNQSSDTVKVWQDYDGHNKDYIDKRQSLQTFTDMHSLKKSIWQHSDRLRTDNSLYPMESQCISADSRTYSDNSAKSHYLSENDLRLELKKRMQEMKSNSTCIETNEMIENRTYSQYNNSWDRNNQRYSQKVEVDLPSTSSIGETRGSSFHQASRIKHNFRESGDLEPASNFNRQRSRSSISEERNTQESFSGRDKNRLEYSFDSRRNKYDRSSSLDRNRNERSSSRSRRSERSSSRDAKRHERSSSHGKIKYNTEKRPESNPSPSRNKSEYLYQHSKSNDQNSVTEERRDWYKSSPRERPEQSSSQDKSRYDCSSSSESKHGGSTNQDKNKFLFSSSTNEYNADNDKGRHCTQSHYENNLSRGSNRYIRNSRHDRSRRDHSSSRDRSRRGNSRSPDSRSEYSSSLEKSRFSSSREGSKDDQSSSESESRYRCNSRSAFNVSKHPSNQHKSRHDTNVNQKKITTENESEQDLIQECSSLQNKKLKSTQNSEKTNEGGLRKISTKDQSKSVEQKRSERSKSKEKIEGNRKPHQKYSRMKSSYKKHYSRSHSSSSESYSSSYSSSSSHGCRPKMRSVPSVIKPVLPKNETENRGNLSENKSVGKSTSLATPQSSIHSVCTKMTLDIAESNKPSNIKSGRMDGDLKASEGKRVPVHMRLGAFPRKRVIQMPKDVEAAFVNSSSSSDGENVNTKCKRQNIRIVTDMFDAKNRIDLIQPKYPSDDKPAKRSSPDTYKEKFKRVKAQR